MTKAFGGVVALDAAEFEAYPGEVAGLIGPNGSGKSTLLNVINGMVECDRGTVRLDGEALEFGQVARNTALGVGRTFQHIRLFPQLTVLENVILGGIHKTLSRPLGTGRLWFGARRVRRQLAERATECLEMAGVPKELREVSPSTLAYGMQRRAEIARALCASPRLLLLDEPAAGMNASEVAALGTLIREVAGTDGITVVLVDHNLDLVLEYVDSLTAFDRGRRIAYGKADEVRRDPAVIASYLGPDALVEERA